MGGRTQGDEPPILYEARDRLARFDRHFLWMVFGLALLLRAAYLKQLVGSPLWGDLPVDLGYYRDWALRIASGEWMGHGLFQWSPFYAYYLAIVFKLFGAGLMAPRLIQIVVGSLTCVLIYRTGRQLFSTGAGLAAGLMAAAYGPFLFYDGMLMKEVFTVFFLTATLYQIVVASGSQRGMLATAGLTLGFGTLVRDNLILLAPALAIWMAIDPWLGGVTLGRDRLREGMSRVLAFGFGLLLVLGPLAARNYHVTGRFVLLRAGGGENFYIGNNPEADGHYVPPPFLRATGGNELEDFRREAARRLGLPLDEVSAADSSDYWFRQGLSWIGHHPVGYAVLLVRKFLLFFNHYELPDNQSYAHHRRLLPILQLPLLTFGLLLPLAAAGIALSALRWRDLLVLYVTGGAYAGTVMLFFNFGRFRLPIVPVLMLFAGYAVIGAAAVLRQAGYGRIALAALAGLLAFGLVGLDLENDPVYLGQSHAQLAELLLRSGRPGEADAESRESIRLLEGFYAESGGALGEGGHGVSPRGSSSRPDLGATFYVVLGEAYATRASVLRAGGHGSAAAAWEKRAALAGAGPPGGPSEPDEAERLSTEAAERAEEGRLEDAAELYRRAAAALPEGVEPVRRFRLRMHLAESLHHAGHPEEALGVVQEALLYPGDVPDADRADAHFGEAMIYRDLGNDAAMRSHLRECLRLNPEHPRAGWIRETLGL